MKFPDWFFDSNQPRIPVVVTPWLPYNATNEAGEPTGKIHWKLLDGKLFMSREAFAELKRVADSGPEERPITS